MAQGARKNGRHKPVFTFIVLLAVGLAAVHAAHANPFGDYIQPYVDHMMDKYFPGGDNRPARAVGEVAVGIISGDADKAAIGGLKASTPSSTASQEQDTPLDRETVHDQPVVPVNPSNENAVPIHNETADHPERPTVPESEPSVGVPPPPPDVRGPVVGLSPFNAIFNQIIATVNASQALPPKAPTGFGLVNSAIEKLFEGSVGATGSVPSNVGVTHSHEHTETAGGAVTHGGGYAGRDMGAASHPDMMVADR